MQQGGQHHAQTEPGVELDGLGVVCGGGAREAGPQCRQDVGQTVPLPHHEHGDEQRQGEACTGARYGARCVLTRVGALRRPAAQDEGDQCKKATFYSQQLSQRLNNSNHLPITASYVKADETHV